MGWTAEGAPEHEGWIASVLADGRIAAGSCAGGVLVGELIAEDLASEREVHRYPGGDVDVVVPWEQVTTWRLCCGCGWTGSERPAQNAPDEPGYRGCDASPDIEAAFEAEWAAHVAPFTALEDLQQLTAQLHELQARIEDTVRTARSAGASWAQLGRAAGVSKQGAQQRWGQP
jgi:hypothetical protein